MTVKYVQSLHQNRLREQNSTANESNNFNDFISGYTECAKSVEQFVCQSPSTDPTVITSLSSHLNQCIEDLRLNNISTHGVIRHTNECNTPSHPFPPSPAPSPLSSMSFTSGSVDQVFDREDYSPIINSSEDIPLNLSFNSRFADKFHSHLLPSDDPMWRPW